MLLLIAATLGAVVGGGLVYAMTHPLASRAPAGSVRAPAGAAAGRLGRRGPTRRGRDLPAERLRGARQWDTCLAYLDSARALDPAGDEAPRVKKARETAIKGIVGKLK